MKRSHALRPYVGILAAAIASVAAIAGGASFARRGPSVTCAAHTANALVPAKRHLQAANTNIHIWVSRDAAPGPKIRLQINATDLDSITLSAYKLDAVPALLQRTARADSVEADLSWARAHLPSKPAVTWTVRLASPHPPHDSTQVNYYASRQINLPVLPPGVYALRASGGDSEAFATVNITNLAVVTKRAPHSLLVWITDVRSGAPLSAARVQFWSARPGAPRGEHSLLFHGVTGGDGVCRLQIGQNAYGVLILESAAANPDHAAMAIRPNDPDGRLIGHMQTDRPVYRPGARVEFKAILRRTLGRGYALVADTDCLVEIRDPSDNVLRRTTVKSSALGTFADSFDISPDAATGAYSIVVRPTNHNDALYQPFTVAEYRKPEFAATVAPEKPLYFNGETVVFHVKAAYYFGAPLPHARVKYQVRRSPNGYEADLDDSESEPLRWYSGGDGNLYERDTYSSQPFVSEGTVETDEHGLAAIPVKSATGVPDMSYSLSCTVIDGQNREVQAEGNTPVYASGLRVAVFTRFTSVSVGANVPVQIRLVDLAGNPVSGRVTLRTQHQVWEEKWQEQRTEVLSHTTVTIGKTGRATATVPALAVGDLEIAADAVDRSGRMATGLTGVWVEGPFEKSERPDEEPALTIRLDKRLYKPGDMVQVYAAWNTLNRPILLTAEGGELFGYVVVPAGKRRACHWSIKADPGMSPNAYISADQWAHPANLISSEVVVPLPDLSRRLLVTVTPDHAVYRPGDTALYTLRVADELTGKPVDGAEASFALVDESIYAVRPDTTADPYGIYWGERPNNVETANSAPEEVSGGAYQRNNPQGVATVRERFLDTAQWTAQTITGPDGTAKISVELPGNLTSWRATVIAITGGTQAGIGRASIVVSRPVMLHLSTPRQFVQGDTLQLIGTVDNQTTRTRSFDVVLNAAGVVLSDSQTAKRVVTVPAKGQGHVYWTVRAAAIPDNADRTATLEGTLTARDLAAGKAMIDLSDRLRVSVPVRPRGVPEQRLAAGTLSSGAQTADLSLTLPAERLEPATRLIVTVRSGLAQAAHDAAARTYTDMYSADHAAAAIRTAATAGAPAPKDPNLLPNALAALSHYQEPNGTWGCFYGVGGDSGTTARVLLALAALKASKGVLSPDMPFPGKMLERAVAGAQTFYNNSGLWEDRAPLAAALATADPARAALLDEVRRRAGDSLSPYATLLLAECLERNGAGDEARAELKKALTLAVIGPNSARFPAGEHPGWSATATDTTAQALLTLMALDEDVSLQTKLARSLANSGRENPGDGETDSAGDATAVARALLRYCAAQGGVQPRVLHDQDVSITVNSTPVAFSTRPAGLESTAPLEAEAPRALLKTGDNTIHFVRGPEAQKGELFVEVQATVYLPHDSEEGTAMRVLRRFELQTVFGTWKTIGPADSVPPGRAVRVTAVVWPNDDADAVAVNEPLPCGFEFVDSELPAYAREEVRDGAILHFMTAQGSTPLTFRYYIRAESEGKVVALPASARLMRRPAIHANSAIQVLTVRKASTEAAP